MPCRATNVVDKRLRAARDKVAEVEATIDVIEELRSPDFPDECAERTLGDARDEWGRCWDRVVGVRPVIPAWATRAID